MQYSEKSSNITQYNFQFEPEDSSIYWSCNWARITLDHDNYTLMSTTDCGNYSYSWSPTPNAESFLRLMARIDGDYLLGKISTCSELDLPASKENTIKNLREVWDEIRQPYHSEKSLEEICDEIEQIDVSGPEMFYRTVEDIVDNMLDFESICTEMVYPEAAKTFCEIFINYLQPELRRALLIQGAISKVESP